jgi:hypothetical protein
MMFRITSTTRANPAPVGVGVAVEGIASLVPLDKTSEEKEELRRLKMFVLHNIISNDAYRSFDQRLDGLLSTMQHRRMMVGGQRFHDLVPDTSPPPTNEAIVTSGAGTICLWQIAPWRTRTQNPKDAIEHATVIYTPNTARLVRQHRLDGSPFKVAEFVAHNWRLRFRSLNHVSGSAINPRTVRRCIANALNLLPLSACRRLDIVANDSRHLNRNHAHQMVKQLRLGSYGGGETSRANACTIGSSRR